ncbi:hypothetical protein ACHAW6_015587 [Cyclotella cf. meneghiniana]
MRQMGTPKYYQSYWRRASTESHYLRPNTATPSKKDRDLTAVREKALLRVLRAKRKEKILKEAQTKEEVAKEEKRIFRQLMLDQKQRQRGVIYTINGILRRKFEEHYRNFLNGENDITVNTSV